MCFYGQLIWPAQTLGLYEHQIFRGGQGLTEGKQMSKFWGT